MNEINIEKVNQALESLQEMATHDVGKNRLLVLGYKGIHEPSISNSKEILDIKNNINKYVLEKGLNKEVENDI